MLLSALDSVKSRKQDSMTMSTCIIISYAIYYILKFKRWSYNKSLSEGSFPTQWKQANVKTANALYAVTIDL